jgi:hypothetical protein
MVVLSAMGSNPYWAQVVTEQQMHEAHVGIQSMYAIARARGVAARR